MTLFTEIRDTLCGGARRRSLAQALNVSPRRVRAWTAGEEVVPEGVWRDLAEMLRRRAVEDARLHWLLMRELYPEDKR